MGAMLSHQSAKRVALIRLEDFNDLAFGRGQHCMYFLAHVVAQGSQLSACSF
jgi:hypothetical protein